MSPARRHLSQARAILAHLRELALAVRDPLDQSPAVALCGKLMTRLDAASLLKARVQLLRIAGLRAPNPGEPFDKPVRIVDLSSPCRHERMARFAPTATPTLLIESVCARPSIVDKIDLLARDADMRLMRYGLPD